MLNNEEKELIKEVKHKLKVNSGEAICEYFGLKKGVYSSWIARGIPKSRVFAMKLLLQSTETDSTKQKAFIKTETNKIINEGVKEFEKTSENAWDKAMSKIEIPPRKDTRFDTKVHNDESLYGMRVELLNIKASAGAGILSYEEANTKTFLLDSRLFKNKPKLENIKVVEVMGDSMNPTLKDGDLVVVDTSKQGDNDGIYVLLRGGEYIVKRLQISFDGKVKIISDNPKYESFNVNGYDEIKALGRVVLVISRV